MNDDFLHLEVRALAYVLREQPDERQRLLAKTPWLHLAPLAQACKDDRVQRDDVAAVLDRPVLRKLREQMQTAEVLEVLTGALDPQAGAQALADFTTTSEKHAWRERARMHHRRLGEALDAGNRDVVDEVVADFHRLDVADVRGAADLRTLWDEHRARQNDPECNDRQGVRLDKRRGELAKWLNSKMGPRGALEPGRTMLIGGAPGGGKTTLGSMLAVDALAVACPVLAWQLELSVAEQLEHLVAQELGTNGSRRTWRDAIAKPLPADWSDMLRIPQLDEPEAATVEMLGAAMRDLAARSMQRRKAEPDLAHNCNGLVLVDYAQLLTIADRGPRDAQHDVLTTAVSRLSKMAGELDMVLVLLSQFTKGAQGAGDAGGGTMTSFAGADLARMAHVAVTLTRADKTGNSTADADSEHHEHANGWARRMVAVKTRGELDRKGVSLQLWAHERTLHTSTKPETFGKMR